MYKGLQNILVRPLFCSLNLLFGGSHWHRGLLQTPSTLRRRNLTKHTSLFLQLGLRSRVLRHENRAFRKRSSNRRNLKTAALSFRVDGKHFKTNAIGSGEPLDFPGRDFLKQKYKTTDCCVFELLRCSVTAGPEPPRFLMKSIIRRRSSMSPKWKNSEVPRKEEMFHKQNKCLVVELFKDLDQV